MVPRTSLLAGGLVVIGVIGAVVADRATTDASKPAQTFTAAADAYVSAPKAATNYGGASELSVDGSPVKRAYLRFVVAGVAGRPSRATLRLYATSSSRGGLAVSRVRDDGWAERSLTWSNAPPIGDAPTASSSGFDPGWVAIDVTSLVAGSGVVSFAITEPGRTAVRLRSREAGGASAPQLVVAAGATGAGASAAASTVTPTTTALPASTSSDGAPPVIAAAGDIACNSAATTTGSRCQQGLTASLIAGDPKVSAVLPLGDIQYECGDYPNLLRFYDPTWGRFRSLTHPAIGNHEYLTTRGGSGCDSTTTVPAKGYFDYWNGVDAATGPAGNRTQGYYSYDVGSWHLIALNSNCARVGGCDAASPQGIWLRNDLAAHPTRCTLAYWHHPRFSSGEHGDDLATGPLWDALYAAGADVVLNGHDHDYERFAPQTPAGVADPTSGIREFVVGTGGKSHYGLQTVQPNSEVRNADTFGVLELTLRPQGYDWRFRPAQGGTFTDSGSATCH